jgi:regulator of RNase E activity RraB
MSDEQTDEQTPPDEWDFYPCSVEGEPASILINLRFMYEDPRDENDHVHHAFLTMTEPGPQGTGTQAEMERLSPIEDAVFDRAEQMDAQPVGRLRSQGVWRLSVYGPQELPWASWIRELAGPDIQVQSDPDPDFEYVNEFLLPDAERHQWIMNRRVCEQLRQRGDDPMLPRPVNHFIDYEDEAPAALVGALKGLGFDVNDLGESLECTKVHPVELEHVHEIVMALVELADQHDAAYDGWGAPVTKPGDAPN